MPDHRDVARVDAALTAALGPGRHVRLTADQGPQARYTAWLKVLRGHVSVVVGNRAAAFAPVRDLGLVAWWDDGDDLLDEPRAPYPHVREILLERGRLEGAAVLSGGFARSVAVQRLVESGELRPIAAASVRRAVPRVVVAGEGTEADRDPAAAIGPPAVDRMAHRQGRSGVRAGARAGAAPGIRPLTRVPDLPRPGALRALFGAGGRVRQGSGACLPLVRSRRRAVRVPGLRRPRAAVLRGRRSTHRRGAGPGLPRGARAHLRGGCGARPGGRGPRPGHRDPGRRAGGRRRLRRGPAARRLGESRPPDPRRRRGGAAPLAGCCGAHQGVGRRVVRSSSVAHPPTRRCRRSRRSCAGTRPGSPPESWPSVDPSACRRRWRWPS